MDKCAAPAQELRISKLRFFVKHRAHRSGTKPTEIDKEQPLLLEECLRLVEIDLAVFNDPEFRVHE